MHDWDTTLKLLITEAAESLLPLLGADSRVKRWLNVELPKTQNLRVDLLAELESGALQHLELQSSNSRKIPFRMLEYSVAIYRAEGRFPAQILIYVGNRALRMQNFLRAPGIDFHFEILDLKTLDGAALMASDNLSANLLALFTALPDKRQAVHRIVTRIQSLEEAKRKTAMTRFLLTCGMRRLQGIGSEETERMPVRMTFMKDPSFIKWIRMLAEKEAREEGREELMRLLLTKKFGKLPAWVDARLSEYTKEQFEDLAVRIFDCTSLEQLFAK